MNLDDIKSNKKFMCFYCEDQITLENYSKWEVFVGAGVETQPICLFCEIVSGSDGEIKKEELVKKV